MKLLSFTNPFVYTIVIITGLFLAACSSGHDHGPTPVGLVLSVDGIDIAMQEEGTITYVENGSHITVPHGGALGPITVQFIKEDGERFFPDTGDGYGLRFSVQNQNVLGFQHPVNNNQWMISLQGLNEGTSTFSLELWHVDHSDFESRNFQVQVVAGAS